MQGIIKTLTDRGFGFIKVADQQGDIFFHAKELVGVTYDELKVGDAVSYELQSVSRIPASNNIIRNGDFLRPYEEQRIVTSDSIEGIELQTKVTAEFIIRLSRNPIDLYQLNAKEFEEVIAEIYEIDGYATELLGSWNQADGGIDILAVKGDIGSFPFRMAIQCKRYAHNRRVSAAPIRSLAGVLDRFHAHAGAIVTTSDFTKPAREEAKTFYWKINLMNFQGIVEALRRAELLVGRPAIFSTDPPTPFDIETVDVDRKSLGPPHSQTSNQFEIETVDIDRKSLGPPFSKTPNPFDIETVGVNRISLGSPLSQPSNHFEIETADIDRKSLGLPFSKPPNTFETKKVDVNLAAINISRA